MTGYAQPDPESYRDRDLHLLYTPPACPGDHDGCREPGCDCGCHYEEPFGFGEEDTW
jgi:hypothetical protein